MNVSNSEIVVGEETFQDIKELKVELRKVSDAIIELKADFKAHKEADVAFHTRETQYFKDFSIKLDKYQQSIQENREAIHDNTVFRQASIWQIRVFWGAIIGGIGTWVVKNVFFK